MKMCLTNDTLRLSASQLEPVVYCIEWLQNKEKNMFYLNPSAAK